MTQTTSVHLLVLIHGMWGNPNHLAELRRIVLETKEKSAQDEAGVDFEVLVAETNREDSTYDGIDWGAERVAKEVYAEVDKIREGGRKVTKLSVTGYSLGGLIARYLIGILHQRKFFEDVEPVNFNTFATPHIGLLRFPSFFSRMGYALGPRLLSRTGQQFYVRDKFSAKGEPLLEVMSDPDRIFYQALQLFPHLTIYANAINDLTVPYITAAIEAEDPFFLHETNGVDLDFDEKYRPLLSSWRTADTPPPKAPGPRTFSAEWWKSVKDYRPALPPFLQFRFPGNYLILTVVPILLPTFIMLAIIRLSLSTHSSRARIQLLEKDESFQGRLFHAIVQAEKRVEDAIVDAVNDEEAISSSAGPSSPQPPPSSTPSTSVQVTVAEPAPSSSGLKSQASPEQEAKAAFKGGPVVPPVQARIIERLNKLPHLRKQIAFIYPARNTHATIVSRDVKNFDFHKEGWGVIQHWADHFQL